MTNNPCPVCGVGAELPGERDYANKQSYNCPRCGPYEITRTALDMLQGRLNGDPKAIARLSHALRTSPRAEGDSFSLTSANLDSLISTPLPDVDRQLDNFLKWISARVGDDRLGRTKLVGTNMIASFVGAVDGERIDRLVQFAVDEGFVEIGTGREIALTLAGWRRLDSLESDSANVTAIHGQSEKTSMPDETQIDDENKIVKANCNTCGGSRNSYQRRIFVKREDDGIVSWSNTIETLECCGCGELSIRHETWFSEWDEYAHDPLSGDEIIIPRVETTYWPPISQRTKPDWADRLSDETLRVILDQVYIALNQGASILAAIGIRTLLDRAMFLRIGDPKNGFAGKIDAMIKGGRIATGDKDTFLILVDVGSAAAHRGHNPDSKTLNTVLKATENFLEKEFILALDTLAVKEATPRRDANHESGKRGEAEPIQD